MKRVKLLSAMMLMATFVLMWACKKQEDPNRVLSINPVSVEVQVDGQQQLTLSLGKDEVKAVKWMVEPADLATITSDGLLTGVKCGKGKAVAIFNCEKAEVPLVVTEKEVPEQPETTEFYYMPYLRFFDGLDAVKAFEASRKHEILEEDPASGYVAFKSSSTLFPTIAYIEDQAIQIYCDKEVIQTDEFYAFMAKNGFDSNREVNHGVVVFTSTKYKTVSCFTVIDIEGYPTGVCFKLKAPTLEKLEQPLLDFSSNEDQVKRFEEGRGFKQSQFREKDDYRELIYGKRIETEEYTNINIIKYLFKANKLIKVTHMISPAHFVFEPAGEMAFRVYKAFDDIVKSMGYVSEKIKDGENAYEVYSLEGKNKFTLESWRLKLGENKLRFAGIAYVPIDGPHKVDSPTF